MALGKSSQRLTALLLAGGAFYFWGAWTLHNLLGNESRTNLVNRQQQQNNETSPLLSVQPQKQPVLVPVAKDTLAPHPIAPTPDGAFSACLLVMDDNHYLIEWLVSSRQDDAPPSFLGSLITLYKTLTPNTYTGLSLSHATAPPFNCRCRSSQQDIAHINIGPMETARNGYCPVGR